MFFPIIKNLFSVTVHKAFFLNAMVSAIIMVLILEFRLRSKFYQEQKTYADVILAFSKTAAIGFLASFSAYYTMYFLTGFGGGMMIPSEYQPRFNL